MLILGLFLVISTFLIPFRSFFPAWSGYNGSYVISPGGRNSLEVRLPWGSIVKVELATTGDSGDIKFFVENSKGELFTEEKSTFDENTVEFHSSGMDSMVLILDNNGASQQSVYWTISIYCYNTTFQILGGALTILGFPKIFSKKTDSQEKTKGQIDSEEMDEVLKQTIYGNEKSPS